MKNILSSLIREFIKVVIIVAIAVPTIALFAAWTGPTGAPPTNNADAPVNVGVFNQIKMPGSDCGPAWIPGKDPDKCGGLSVGTFVSQLGTLLAKDGGNVGIGTVSPQAKLHVVGGDTILEGGIQISDTINTNAGTIRWTGIDFEGYTGATWVSLTAVGASGSCPSPKQLVLVGSQLICLNDGAYAGLASVEAQGNYKVETHAEARYQGGILQIKVRGRNGGSYCDTGWVNGIKTGCLVSSGEITPRGVIAVVKRCVTGHAAYSCTSHTNEKLWP